MKITVVGCGYVGLVSGVGLAASGHEVTGVDISEERVGVIRQGKSPFYEPGLERGLAEVFESGQFQVATKLESVAEAEVIMICVGTPAARNGAIELKMLREAIHQIADAFRNGDHYQVVVVRSTVVPGTTESLVWPVIERAAKFRAHPVGLAVNPEFLREGRALKDFLNPDRIVIGELDSRSGETLSKVYEAFDAPLIRTTPAAAEMIKYTSNALLATLISFSNEIARICESLPGVDVEEVLNALHLDRRLTLRADGRRISAGINQYLKAGCSYGGSCLPKDVEALIALARERRLEPQLLTAVQAVNQSQRIHLVDLAERSIGGLKGKRALILGLSFKEGTDDVRDSPAFTVAAELLRRGASVVVADPLVKKEQVRELLELGAQFADDPVSAFKSAELCFITTSAAEFKFVGAALGPAALATKQPVVVDGRRVISPSAVSRNQNYIAIGLGSAVPRS